MTASLYTPDFTQYRRNRLRYMHGATIYLFPKEARRCDSSAALDYMDAWTELSCQAATILASSLALYFRALGVSRLHPSQDGDSACKKIYPSQGKRSPNAEDQA